MNWEKKKLLRKAENKNFPNTIVKISVFSERIFVADIQEGIFFAKFSSFDKNFSIFADEITPRWITSFSLLDPDTIASLDKFGNFNVSRLSSEVSEIAENDTTGAIFRSDNNVIGAQYKLEHVANFFISETSNQIVKAALSQTSKECLFHISLLGTIGAFIPLISREEVNFFNHLEMHLRQEKSPISGRDHLAFRSYYFPSKNVIDGDLCEEFVNLSEEMQRNVAQELERSPEDVLKKLEEVRNRLI